MARRQFHVLYREFLFRIVDRELLSTYARGDMSKLLLQLASLLIFLSVLFSAPVVFFDLLASGWTPQEGVLFAWSHVHFLIATTMLVVGLFAILSWNGLFPDRLDVLVLSPLPVGARTVFLAKVTAVATALSLTVLLLHVVAGLVWPLLLHAVTGLGLAALFPAGVEGATSGGVFGLVRLFLAYWITMLAAGLFTFGLVMGLQGAAAHLLPRQSFLRVSSYLQLAAFVVVVSVYVLQPTAVTSATIAAAQQPGFFSFPPSYWFLGLFHQLSGSPVLEALSWNAWWGLGLTAFGTTAAYALSYVRTLRRIAEEPDIAPGSRGVRWLPSFRSRLQTAIVQFSIRTLVRSPQHRVILAFYWGIGLALVILFLKTPLGQGISASSADALWRDASVPLLVANVLMLVLAVLGIRVAFSLPCDLRANWIFRIAPVRGGPEYLAARRRSLLALSVAPIWAGSAVLFLSTWPWLPAAGHLLVLALLGMMLVEVCLYATQKIPFTCSYLPGKAASRMMLWLGAIFLVPLTTWGAVLERQALQDLGRYATMVAVLGAVWIVARWLTAALAKSADAEPQFEEEPSDQLLSLNVWDSRFPSAFAEGTENNPPLIAPSRRRL